MSRKLQQKINFTTLMLATTYLGFAVPQAMAAPTGGQVVGGKASIAQNGHQTDIDQSTPKAAIEWKNFNVDADETVQFKVPDGGSTLNRVVGLDPSVIKGTVRSNGEFYLVNRNGLVFDTNSKLYANSVVATTADFDPKTYLIGGIKLWEGDAQKNSAITLKGTISVAEKGVVAVYAPHIDNQGAIDANSGVVLLQGINHEPWHVKHDYLDILGTIHNTAEKIFGKTTVINSGTITSEGGQVILSTEKSNFSQGGLVKNTGLINVSSTSLTGGLVSLSSLSGSVTAGGKIDASGGQGGGKITLSAAKKILISGTINALGLKTDKPKDAPKANGGSVEITSYKSLKNKGKITLDSLDGGKDGTVTNNQISDAEKKIAATIAEIILAPGQVKPMVEVTPEITVIAAATSGTKQIPLEINPVPTAINPRPTEINPVPTEINPVPNAINPRTPR